MNIYITLVFDEIDFVFLFLLICINYFKIFKPILNTLYHEPIHIILWSVC